MGIGPTKPWDALCAVVTVRSGCSLTQSQAATMLPYIARALDNKTGITGNNVAVVWRAWPGGLCWDRVSR